MKLLEIEDGTLWPGDTNEIEDLSYVLRHSNRPLGKLDRMFAASIIDRYISMIRMDIKTRNRKVSMIRKACTENAKRVLK